MSSLKQGLIAIWLGVLFAPGLSYAAPRILSVEAWRADLDQLTSVLVEDHPAPFRFTSEEEFLAEVARLRGDIPDLDDHAIMLRMAALLSLVEDGHTRLSLPRVHPQLAYSTSHASDPDPVDERLRFDSLPVVFRAFEDGLFITDAAPEYQALIGAEVVSIGSRTSAELLVAAGAIVEAENSGARDLHASDRLALIEVLEYLGVNRETCGIPMTVRMELTDRQTCLRPLDRESEWPGEAADHRNYSLADPAPAGAVVARIDRIDSTEDAPLAAFMQQAVAAAENEDAAFVLDLRRNAGGNGDLNRAIILPLLFSEEINQFGRLFVLTGPRTFSAAQLLVNDLQHYSRAIFVGEPTGSRPDHYGDSARTVLTNSGLTVRVSSLHWSSGVANDARDATTPHIPAVWTSAAYLAGEDPALEAALAYRYEGFANLLRNQIALGAGYNIYLLSSLEGLSPGGEPLSAQDFLDLGAAYEANEQWLEAQWSYRAGLWALRDDLELEAALAAVASRVVAD